jgi:RHS repeat-associated protein
LDRYASRDTSEFVANTSFTYDLANRLTSLQHARGLTALAGYDYTYDAAGRFTSIDSFLDGLTEYTHDAAGQLTDADHASITDEAYEYDDNGNRVMSGYVVGANNRISTNGVFDFEYDDEGNMVAKEEISSGERIEYEWDHRNRLIRIVFKDEYDAVVQVVEQTYDYQNRWVRSQIDADGDEDFDSERFFAYDGNQIVLDFAGDAASDLSHRYLWGSAVDQILAVESVDSLTSAGDVLWPLTDHLNTTRDLAEYNAGTDTASIASHRVFDSFGNLVSESAPAIITLFGFTARPFDVASGLQWNLNRWYISTLGVWVSEDPIAFAAGDSSLRRYVGNATVTSVDPSGLFNPDLYQPFSDLFGDDSWGPPINLPPSVVPPIDSILPWHPPLIAPPPQPEWYLPQPLPLQPPIDELLIPLDCVPEYWFSPVPKDPDKWDWKKPLKFPIPGIPGGHFEIKPGKPGNPFKPDWRNPEWENVIPDSWGLEVEGPLPPWNLKKRTR